MRKAKAETVSVRACPPRPRPLYSRNVRSPTTSSLAVSSTFLCAMRISKVEGNDVDGNKADGSSVDRSNGGESRSLEVAIPVIERTVSLLRSLRARAGAPFSAGWVQKGAVESTH